MNGMKKGGVGIVVACLFCLVNTLTAAETREQAFEQAAGLLKNGKHTEALRLYQILAAPPAPPRQAARALFLKASVLCLYLNQPKSALKLFHRVHIRFPDSPAAADALFHMGMIYYELKNYPKAAKTFATYLRRYPRGDRRASAETWRNSAMGKARKVSRATGPTLNDLPANPVIRILMAEKTARLDMAAASVLIIRDTVTGKEIHRGKGPASFTRGRGELKLNGQNLGSRRCSVESDRGPIAFQNRRWRGAFSVALEPDGLQAINHVDIEQYLYGIIPKEMPHTWPQDTLKAQAVAARTYVLYSKGKNRFMPFDVEATTASQVYGGYDAETRRTNQAVDDTRGQVITYGGRLIIAYFHANSAGHTENARHVWQVDLPYLRGIPDPYSQNIPNGNWEYALPYATASHRLNQAGLNVGAIQSLKIIKHSSTGRVLDIAVASGIGNTVLSANHLRHLLGPKRIKSTYFQIIPASGGVILKGKGYGHGVGMSQWGAKQMAELGHTFQKILRHYYPGSRLASLGDGR